jgi:hypothetical protein
MTGDTYAATLAALNCHKLLVDVIKALAMNMPKVNPNTHANANFQ